MLSLYYIIDLLLARPSCLTHLCLMPYFDPAVVEAQFQVEEEPLALPERGWNPDDVS